jgi:hypothetical protein
MQCLFVVLHGTLGSYLRDALQKGGVANIAYLPTPRAFFASGVMTNMRVRQRVDVRRKSRLRLPQLPTLTQR